MLRNNIEPKKKLYAKKLRKYATPAEIELWRYLRKRQLNVRFKRQVIVRG